MGTERDDAPAEATEFIEVDQATDGSVDTEANNSADGPNAANDAEAADPDDNSDTDTDTDFETAADETGDDTGDGPDQELADTIGSEIDELAAERDSYRDIAQRLQADFENYRKRMSAQMTGEIDRATAKLAEALLPVLDAAEAAYVQHPDEVGPLLNLMLTELRKRGLETIDLLDQPFDPNLADAVAHEDGEGHEVVVADVLRSGYSWNGRTLRPAMVRTRS